MESIEKWYSREVWRWRTGASVVWSVLYVPAGCFLYTVLSQFSIYPLAWITNIMGTVFTLGYVMTVLMMMVVTGVFCVYSSRTFAVIPSSYTSRLSQVLGLCRAPCLAYMAVCAITGMILARLGTGKLGDRYTQLAYKCAEDSNLYCINEHHLFLVLYGGYTGVMYTVYHYVRQHNLLHFPTEQQAKYFRVRTQVGGVAWMSLGHVLWQFKFYYLLYYLLGHIPRNWIVAMLSLKYGQAYTLDSVYGLLDIGLLWQTLVLGLSLQFNWAFSALLYKVYNTQHYEFPLSTMFDNFKNKCLVDAMSCINNRLVQALGFYDLNLLSKHSYSRRCELFSLSQPGGHPHNWNKMIAVCLSVITELSDSVREANWKILAHAPVRHPSTEKTGGPTSNGHTPAPVNGVQDTGKPDIQKPANKLTLKDKIMQFIQQKKPSLTPVTKESPELRSKNLFASAFIQIWAVEAVSGLVAASYMEDSYGVVQMSLKDILIAMLNLQEDIDKHFKLSGGVSRRVTKDQSSAELPLKYSLHSTLRSSIYRIVNTFGKHLLDVGLPPETEKKLQHFLEYKE